MALVIDRQSHPGRDVNPPRPSSRWHRRSARRRAAAGLASSPTPDTQVRWPGPIAEADRKRAQPRAEPEVSVSFHGESPAAGEWRRSGLRPPEYTRGQGPGGAGRWWATRTPSDGAGSVYLPGAGAPMGLRRQRCTGAGWCASSCQRAASSHSAACSGSTCQRQLPGRFPAVGRAL